MKKICVTPYFTILFHDFIKQTSMKDGEKEREKMKERERKS